MTTKHVKLLDLDSCIEEAIPWGHAVVEASANGEREKDDEAAIIRAPPPLVNDQAPRERQDEEETIPLVVFSVDFYVDDGEDAVQVALEEKEKKLLSEASENDDDSLCTISTSDSVLWCLSSSCQILWEHEEGKLHCDDAQENAMETLMNQHHHHHRLASSAYSLLETISLLNDVDDIIEDEEEIIKSYNNANKEKYHNLPLLPPPPTLQHLSITRPPEQRDDYHDSEDDEFICVGDLPRIYWNDLPRLPFFLCYILFIPAISFAHALHKKWEQY